MLNSIGFHEKLVTVRVVLLDKSAKLLINGIEDFSRIINLTQLFSIQGFSDTRDPPSVDNHFYKTQA
jgi:hypothetical protein